MSNNGKVAAIAIGAVAGAAIIATGIYLGAKYIPYAVEDARHRARQFELDHRDQFAAVKHVAKKAQGKVASSLPRK